MIRKAFLIIFVLSGLFIFANTARAASCTGPDWHCWNFNKSGICVDQGDNKSCQLNSGGTACFYDSTGCCAESGRACTYSSGGTTPTPTPGNNCGTVNCDTSTEVCCPTGCKPIAEGCTGPTPTPPPVSYQCTVQGYKVLMPGLLTGAPADSQTVTLNDPLTSTSTQPYFLYYQSAGKSRTVTVSVPPNYTVVS